MSNGYDGENLDGRYRVAQELVGPGTFAWRVPGETGGLSRAGVIAAGIRLAQHHAVAPLVHDVVHRDPAPAVVAGGVGELNLGAPGDPPAGADVSRRPARRRP